MDDLKTKYGILKGVSAYSTYENGQINSVCIESENKLDTLIGTLIPRYQDYTGRRKSTSCLTFYKSGSVKSIDLQQQTAVSTPVGFIEAELVTFYENGSVKRIFPLNGALSGYWSEEDEAGLCKELSFNLLNKSFNLKINGIFFYPDGAVKSVSFFPGETAFIPTPSGEIKARIGISLSEAGSISSLEPSAPAEINTPIGVLHAYASNALGIHADKNSLVFEDSLLRELTSSTDIIKITDKADNVHYLSPGFVKSSIDPDKKALLPMKIIFNSNSAVFITSDELTIDYKDIKDIRISTMPLYTNECTDCTSCGKCGSGL
ncbi:hypothetical protein LY28_02493 [Ruminiclostridium sufflavum DSM 19573]|uniref:MORN repeat protein n=1 Tax=Ruminiclostridium sufflavum DSM 19573 TaxID=1121337 RepID=A0A318XIQ7_9FIRM|nr:hypothetical protein [Ruminiclostridium sufflavum]PYG87110.1 hypothetical protein LY28_02493 [Ruminiclostridium sufflavum DSM 19573]